MDKKDKLSPDLVGVSGEYFVAAELSKRGYIASITLRNTKGVDILCSNSEASKTVGIQVKTNSGSGRSWILSKKAEDNFAENLFYVFVNLHSNQRHPEFFVVPSKVVAQYCKNGHAEWLNTPGRNGQKRKDSNMRKFDDPDEEYLNCWDSLHL